MELLVQQLEQNRWQSSERVALWRASKRSARSDSSHEVSAAGITSAALFQWINAVRDALLRLPPVEPTSSSTSSASSPSPFRIVGIALPPCSIEESALVLAVVREKCWVYVPIDVMLPLSQQVFILQDARVSALVTFPEAAIAQFLAENAGGLINNALRVVDSDARGLFRSLSVFSLAPSAAPAPQSWILSNNTDASNSAVDPLYILYTSGSTGDPKGVIGTRRGARNRLEWMWKQFPFDDHSSESTNKEEERVVRVTKLTFVDSVWEILGALLKRKPLVHLAQQTNIGSKPITFPAIHAILDQSDFFLQVAEQFQVSRFTVVPSVLEILLLRHSSNLPMLQKAFASVRYMLVSGEVLPLSLIVQVTRVLPHIKLLNLYGSTEVSGDITWLEIQAPLSQRDLSMWTEQGVPIGRIQNRIGNTRLRLRSTVNGSLDEYVELQPGTTSRSSGSPGDNQTSEGELLAAGHALALGYTRDDAAVGDGDEATKKWVSLKEDGGKSSATWFRMGDICKVQGDFIFFCGRSDSLVKIRGQRIQLEAVERIVESGLSEVTESTQRANILHVVVLTMKDYSLSSQVLVAFLLTQASENIAQSQTSDSLVPAFVAYPQKALLFKWIKDKFGDAYVPRDVVLVAMNSVERLSSGKLDKSAIRALYELKFQATQSEMNQDEELSRSVSRVERFLQAQISKVLGVTRFGDPGRDATMSRTFLEIGGSSLHATLLSWEVQQEFGCVIQPQELLSSPLEAVVKSLERRHLEQLSGSTDGNSVMPATSEASISARLENAIVKEHDTVLRATKRLRHTAQQFQSEVDTSRTKTSVWGLSRVNLTSSGRTFIPSFTSRSVALKSLRLELAWKFDLSKCIDASPLIVRHSEGSHVLFTWIAIGSHSAEFACLDVKNRGNLIWKRKLDDRIEASASMSEYNQTLYVGTYSGALYAMDALTGDVEWVFHAKDAIKAAVLVVDELQLVVCGAYDHFVYGLDSVSGEKQWELSIADGGSVFSTPIYDAATNQLFFASTKGNVCCVSLRGGGDDGQEPAAMDPKVHWTRQVPAPVFSSLTVAPELSLLFVGCADGNMYALSAVDGEIRWKVETRKPIFSSPCICNDPQDQSAKKSSVVFGSHDGVLRKVSCENGQLLWERHLENPIFSSPTVFEVARASSSPALADNCEPGEPKKHVMICVATIDGTLFVCDESSGAIVTQVSSVRGTKETKSSFENTKRSDAEELQPPLGELFSSPVVIDDFCIIGSRSNQLYAFRVATE